MIATSEDDMAVDATLWFILAVGIAFIYCGCVCTARGRKPLYPREGTADRKMDLAA